VNPRRAAAATVAGAAIGVAGVGINGVFSDGDLRVGPLPWAMGAAMGCLAYCSLGVLSFHSDSSNGPLTFGAWWTTLAFAGIGVFFLALAVGGLLGVDEDEAGGLVMGPLLGVMFGVASIGPANLLLAGGVRRAGLLPVTSQAALWAVSATIPALLIVGGLSEGTIEIVGSAAVVAVFAALWIRIGASLKPSK
jgi:hypothetical protein